MEKYPEKPSLSGTRTEHPKNASRVLLDAAEKRAGPIGHALVAQMNRGEIDQDGLKRELEKVPDFQEFQKDAEVLFESLGILEKEDGHRIVDTEKIKRLTISLIKKRFDHVSNSLGETLTEQTRNSVHTLLEDYPDYIPEDSISHFLFNAFYNVPVVAKEEWQAWKKSGTKTTHLKEIPLFYSPKDTADAFDREKIRSSEFHLGLWETGGVSKKDVSKRFTLDYSPFHPGLTFQEASLAAAIYHPSYGDGERDSNGRLIVTYRHNTNASEIAERRPITHEWLETSEHIPGMQRLPLENTRTLSPREYLQKGGFPELVRTDLIRPTDFFTEAISTPTETYELSRRITNNKGSVIVNDKIRYTLGRAFGTGEYAVHRISDSLAAIVKTNEDGTEQMTHTLQLLSPDSPDLVPIYHEGKIAFYDATQRRTGIKPIPFNEQSIGTPRREQESKKEYRKRQEIETFVQFLHTTNKLRTHTPSLSENLSPREQYAMVETFRGEEQETEQEPLYHLLRQHKELGMKVLLAIESDPNAVTALLRIDRALATPDMTAVLRFCADQIDEATQKTEPVAASLGLDQNDGKVQHILFNAFNRHLKETVSTLAETLSLVTDEAEKKQALQSALKKSVTQTPEERTRIGLFTEVADILQRKEQVPIDLKSYVIEQDRVTKALEGKGQSGLLLRTLVARGELQPIPEIHWRVDRTKEDWTRRFGFDIHAFLEQTKIPGKKKLLLEFGPGNGQSKWERSAQIDQSAYTDIAMADTLYYPLDTVITNLIDWNLLETTTGQPLTPFERGILADALYKAIMITDGEAGSDHFSYAKERMQRITQNPELLKEILLEVAPSLKVMTDIPDTISTRDTDGQVVYPYKINLETKEKKSLTTTKTAYKEGRSLAFAAARAALATEVNTYVKKDVDVFDCIPAHPTGFMVGDFSDIKRLRNKQIDVAIGLRSTVYKKNEDYVEFMFTLADKLTTGGVMIDDNVRDNDGYYYRLGELLSVQEVFRQEKGNAVHMHLIIGPGFPGEDYRQDAVPLGVVMSKGTDYSKTIEALMAEHPEYSLVTLDEYVSNRKTLQSLDTTGKVYQTVEEVSRDLGLVSSKSASKRRAA